MLRWRRHSEADPPNTHVNKPVLICGIQVTLHHDDIPVEFTPDRLTMTTESDYLFSCLWVDHCDIYPLWFLWISVLLPKITPFTIVSHTEVWFTVCGACCISLRLSTTLVWRSQWCNQSVALHRISVMLFIHIFFQAWSPCRNAFNPLTENF